MSVIVTGASGQLGRLVIEELLAKVPASEVTALVRDPGKAAGLAARGVVIAVADYNSPGSAASERASRVTVRCCPAGCEGRRE